MDEGIWIRQGNDVQGPFPRERILTWMHEDKILTNMMLSGDGRNWRPADDASDLLLPEPVATSATVPPRRGPRRARGREAPAGRGREAPHPGRRSGLAVGISIGGAAVAVLAMVLTLGQGGDDPRSEGRAASVPQQSTNPTAPSSQPVESVQQPELDSSRPLTSEQIVAAASPAVAFIRGQRSTGTGFVIRPNLVVTNHHVISDEFIGRVRVLFPDASDAYRGQYHPTVIYENPERDLALLKLEAQLKPLETSTGHTFRRGQEVLVIGNPGLAGGKVLRNAVSHGVLSSEMFDDGQSYYQLGISVNPGNSGGPVLGSDGRVVGVVVAKATFQEGIAFGIPIAEVEAAVRQAQRLSHSDVASVQSMHRARACAEGLAYLAGGFARLMEIYVSGILEAESRGLNPGLGLDMAHELVKSVAKGYDFRRATELKEEVGIAASDARLSESTRRSLQALWDNFVQVRSRVLDPMGASAGYVQSFKRLTAEREDVLATLRRNGVLLADGG